MMSACIYASNGPAIAYLDASAEVNDKSKAVLLSRAINHHKNKPLCITVYLCLRESP